MESELDPQKMEIARAKVESLTTLFSQQSVEACKGAITALSTFAEAIAQIDFIKIYDNLSNVLKALSEVVLNIASPISEEERLALINSYKQWGKIGWTVPLDASMDVLDTPPDPDIKKANAYIMQRYRQNASMNSLFDFMRKHYQKSDDLNSAIFCFENRQYKACSLLLFCMIEARLIKAQHKTPDLKTGLGAVVQLKKQNKAYGNNEVLFTLLQFVNLFSCLTEMFQDTKNFSQKMVVINRNYLAHGVNKRQVLRQDCIQLFLALANLLFFLDQKEKQSLQITC